MRNLENLVQNGARQEIQNFDQEALEKEVVTEMAKKHLPDVKPEEQQSLYDRIVGKAKEAVTYSKGLLERATEKLSYANVLQIAADIYSIARDIPALYSTYIRAAFIGGKTLLEAPGVLTYLYKTGKQQGAKSRLGRLLYGTYYNGLDLLGYGASKLVGMAIPVLGPAIEAGAFKRLVQRKASGIVDSWFDKLKGTYKPVMDRISRIPESIYERIQNIAGPIRRPEPKPLYGNLTAELNPA